MEKQIVVLLKELEKATYGDENSRHNNHPDAFAFKNLAQEIFRVGYTLYEDKNNAPKYNFINLIGNNCSGRVCKWIEDGGLNAPFSSNIPGVKPAWNKGKKSYSPFH